MDAPTELQQQLARRAFAAAYQVTGSVADAEDIRQEVLLEWLELSHTQAAAIENPVAYWGRAAAHKALNRVQRQSRESYIGPWLPEPVLDERNLLEQRADLSYAFVHLLAQLSPPERAVFILRESLELPFADIAEALDLSADGCRKLHQRARERLAGSHAPQPVARDTQERLLGSFMQAIATGDFGTLQSVLREDAVLYSDGGGKRAAALVPVRGSQNAFKFLWNITQKNIADGKQFSFDVRYNGLDILLVITDLATQTIDTVMTLDMREGQIHNIFLQRNPDKLVVGNY